MDIRVMDGNENLNFEYFPDQVNIYSESENVFEILSSHMGAI